MGLVNHLIHKLESKIDKVQSQTPGQAQNQAQNQNHTVADLNSQTLQLNLNQQDPNSDQTHAIATPTTYSRPAMPIPTEKTAISHSPVLGDDIFKPMLAKDPLSMFRSAPHPVPLPSTTFEDFSKHTTIASPVETNSFYTNLLLDAGTAPVWTHPYSLWYTNKPEEQDHFGLAVSHTSAAQRVFGANPARPQETQYFFNPAGIKSFVVGAAEFSKSNLTLAVDKCEKFSCNVHLFAKGDPSSSVEVPLVQGMGFVTCKYANLTAKIESAIGILSFQRAGQGQNGTVKYQIQLFNQVCWSMYVTNDPGFVLQSPNCIVARKRGNCVVQLASGQHLLYDHAAGAYATGCQISAAVQGDRANYRFRYRVEGTTRSTVMYALSHHVDSFSSDMAPKLCKNLVLDSTIAGPMQAYLTDEFSMVEKLPKQIAFEPWTSLPGVHLGQYSQDQLQSIRKLCILDMQDDVAGISNNDSMYSSGKILDKYATVLYVAAFILKDDDLARQYLPKVKEAVQRFTSNKQQCPLVYDSTWKGLVSSAGLDGDIFRDFGNTHYNDHHFHYGYHIHAAAVLALCDNKVGDGSFLKNYQEYVNFLVKDVANPVKDSYFPESRSFDWFNGHSWAKGLFASFDGKDEESSSEDYHFAYGLKLWGKVTGDLDMENRGDLMLAVMKRSMNLYMLYKDDNKIQPREMVKNKVSGILFENKVDHATYFGLNLEYIQGIHMLPITPVSSFIRDPEFVKQEWETLLKDHVKTLDDGWKGILMLNLALYKPQEAWNFFNDKNFDRKWLDNGMSLTWSLAYIAGVSK